MKNAGRGAKHTVTKRTMGYLIPVYFMQAAFLLFLFFVAKEYFGYICLGSLLAQQLLSVLFNNVLPSKPMKVLFFILRFLGGGFLAIVRIFSDSEKKGLLTGSVIQIICLSVQGATTLLLFYIWLFNSIPYLLASLIASVVVALGVLLTRRDTEEKITEVLLIFILLGYGYLLFTFSSPKLYFLRFARRYKHYEKVTRGGASDENRGENELERKLFELGARSAEYDAAEYFTGGKKFFDDVKIKLAEAEEYIYLEFFLYEEGELFYEIAPILKKKVGEGVKISMICDDVGTYRSAAHGILKELIDAGVRCAPYNRVVPLTNTFVQYRDHRKMVVIDGKSAYVGGVNIADEYINLKRPFGFWKDAGIRIDGAVAEEYAHAFRAQWYAITGEMLPTYSPSHRAHAASGFTAPYFDGHEGKRCREIYLELISSAKEKITIVSPYFVPGTRVLRLLRKKALEGVEVTIIYPGTADKFYVHAVTKINAESLRKYGVKVYAMHNTFTHAKLVQTESYASVGTANFDHQSFNKSSECGVITNDEAVMEKIKMDLDCMIAVSEPITDKNCFKNNKFQYFAATIYRLVSILM